MIKAFLLFLAFSQPIRLSVCEAGDADSKMNSQMVSLRGLLHFGYGGATLEPTERNARRCTIPISTSKSFRATYPLMTDPKSMTPENVEIFMEKNQNLGIGVPEKLFDVQVVGKLMVVKDFQPKTRNGPGNGFGHRRSSRVGLLVTDLKVIAGVKD